MPVNPYYVDIARIFLVTFMLAYASYLDIKERRVSNRIWAIFTPFAIVLLILDIIGREYYEIIMMIINILVVSAFGFASFYLGILGGADAKAIMILSVMLPRWPVYTIHPMPYVPMVLDALILSAIITLAYFPGCLIYNVLHGELELPRGLYGIKLCKQQALEKKDYYIPLYVVKEDGSIEFRFRMLLPPEEEIEKIWKAIEDSDLEEIWISPGIPFIVYLFIGIVITMVYGDIIMGPILGITVLR